MPKPKHAQKTQDFSYFEETMATLNIDGPQLSVACGYAKTSWHHWKNAGKMPIPAGMACECLLRRKRKEATHLHAKHIYVVLVNDEFVSGFESFCNATKTTYVRPFSGV